MLKDLYEIGEIPPLGHVPKNMYSLGDPQGAPRAAGGGDADRSRAHLGARQP